MRQVAEGSSQVRFGLFKVDLDTGELWKAGHRLKLQTQPFKILRILLERPGDIVTRDELQSMVWGPDVTVDYEQSLGSAIKKIREAIQDSADNPKFIETVPRKGYRFIAPVTWADRQDGAATLGFATPHAGSKPVSVSSHELGRYVAITAACAIVVALSAAATRVWDSRHQQIIPVRISQVTYDGRIYSQGLRSFETLPATVADGERLFTSSVLDRQAVLSRISVTSGEMQQLLLPSEVTEPEINDLSRDGGNLLVLSQSTIGLQESERPLWIIPTNGGSASRVANVLAHAAVWMPDGKKILYATGNDINEVSPESGASQHFATVPGRAFWMRWSPDGALLRFTILDLKTNRSSLWELGKDHREAHQVLASWNSSRNECCGVWTSDGRLYVFQSTHDGHTDLWKLDDSSDANPVQVTNGPMDYQAPASGREGERIYFLGRSPHVEWKEQEFDARQKTLEPRRDFLSTAGRVTFSRDHAWVAWTDAFGHLWRARTNGTEKLQLTSDSIQVLYTSWSPDGKSLALMAHGPSEPWQIYRVPFSGGSLENLLPRDAHGVGDPTFSPDGRSLLFGGLPYLMAASPPRSLAVLDLKTHQIAEIPDSHGFHSPRWSPNGRYVAALSGDQKQLMLYDLSTRKWKVLVEAPISDPVWVSDSKAIYINTYKSAGLSISRVSVPDGAIEQEVIPGCDPSATHCFLSGVTPDDVPLIVVEMIKSDLYTIDFLPR